MWKRRYDFLPTCEPFLTPELATSPDYMGWFRLNNKQYLLLDLERSRQHRCRRPRQGPINPRFGDGDAVGPTYAQSTSKDPTAVGHPHNHRLSPRRIHDERLGHDQVQPWRKETKSSINPDVYVNMKL
ncbi:hypothetical protein Goarm_011244, partial [Gossypium armourianum]|nr:hypothetical protein [Gossypium armourianum]